MTKLNKNVQSNPLFVFSGEDAVLIWKFGSKGRSMMQQKLEFYWTPDYTHGRRDWTEHDIRVNNLHCNVSHAA